MRNLQPELAPYMTCLTPEVDRRDERGALLAAPGCGDHLVHFYEEEASLLDVVEKFLGAGLDAGDGLIVVATREHERRFLERLKPRDVARAVASGQLLLLDARATLERFMVNGRPDAGRFHSVLEAELARVTRAAPGARVRAYGEMVDLLWQDGERSSAIALEALWNEAGARHGFSLLCAYVIANFYEGGESAGIEDVRNAHSHVLTTDSRRASESVHEPAPSAAPAAFTAEDPEIVRLRTRLRSAELELERLRETEQALRQSSLEQRRADEAALLAAEARFHHLVDAVTDYAIFMLDAAGHVVTWNPGAQKTKGYARDEIVGRHFSAFYTPEDRAAGKPGRVLEAVRRSGRFEEESVRVRKDGSRYFASTVITALRDEHGRITGFAKVTRDLTAKRAAEERERELASAQLRRELERVSRVKDEFVATVSHELRTPLNAMLGWATLLRRDPSDPAKLARGLEVIERNAKTEARLVSDLLDVSRIVNGKLCLALKPADVAEVILAAADAVRPAAEAKGVQLLLDLAPETGVIVADPDRLQQIAWNLLSNAVRFTPAGGRVTASTRRDGAHVTLDVRDTGVGIAAADLPHVFERFRQVDGSITRAHGGLGLGLAIVRHLVEAHGGSVFASSAGLGEGASFTVTLPVTTPGAPDPAGGPGAGPAPEQARESLRNRVECPPEDAHEEA